MSDSDFHLDADPLYLPLPQPGVDRTHAPARGTPLCLIEVLDRNGVTVNRFPVMAFPVTVGRIWTSDVVVDDVYVAPAHLQLRSAADGALQVDVLESINGVQRPDGSTVHTGCSFSWHGGDLHIGRSRLRLLGPGVAMLPERRLPTFPWRAVLRNMLALGGLMAIALVQAWFSVVMGGKFWYAVIPVLAFLLGGLFLWAGVWALATKLFTGRVKFWRHVRVACATLVVSEVVSGLAYGAAFAFSWEVLAHFNPLWVIVVLGIGLYQHLAVLAPQRRGAVRLWVSGLLVLGVSIVMGLNWQQNKRLSDELYVSALFPPAWRVAPAVPVSEWMAEVGELEQRLEKRLNAPAEQDEDDVPNLDAIE